MRRGFVPVLGAVVVVVGVGVGAAAWLRRGAEAPAPIDPARATFVAPELCFECHEEQTAAWRGSHHDLAMQEATEETVRGDFADVEFTHFGVTSRFFRRDGRFLVHTDGPDGALADFEVKYVFGWEPLQQYLIELDGGRLQTLQISWDTVEKRWFHIHDEPIRHDDPLHWTAPQFNWNTMCAECHSTDLRKNYDAETDRFETTWHEIDVGCQGCHGPGSAHVAWARHEPETYAVDDPKGMQLRLSDPRSTVQIEACARCHARRTVVDGDYRYGAPFSDLYEVQLLREDLYHPDGQIVDEVYVYGSFLQSKMYRKGVRCTDCHDPHTARLRLEGNLTCVRCHKEEPPPQFDTLRSKEYDTPEHHFHETGTPGSFCVDCHMPSRTYMVVDPRRDHGFVVPRPDLPPAVQPRDVCTDCHADKGRAWSAAEIAKRLGPPDAKPPFAAAIAAGRAGAASAPAALAAVVADAEQAGIVRATAISLLGRFPGGVARDAAVGALADPDPIVRAAAVSALETLLAPRDPRRAELLAPSLTDGSRLVRTEAARLMAGMPPELRRPRDAFDRALAEFRARQAATSERPESHLNLGVLAAELGDPAEAEREYRTALRLGPWFHPARFNLANLYDALGRPAEAEPLLREVLAAEPENGEAHYSLGLLLAGMKRMEEAARHLGRASALLGGRPRVRYNHALVLQSIGQVAAAERELVAALDEAPRDRDLLHALVALYAETGRIDDAIRRARVLAEVAPELRPLLQGLEAAKRENR